MSGHTSLPRPAGAEAIPLAQVQALRRVALAVAHPGGPDLFADLVRELAASLQVGIVFVAVFADDSRSVMRTLAVCLDGGLLRQFDYPLEGSPCTAVVGRSFQFMRSGLSRQLAPGSVFARERMDSFAAFSLNDSAGEPLGLLVAMDRQPIAGGDADHAEAMLKIIAGRAAAEIERGRNDEALRAAALAVSASRSGTVFDELVRLLATILHVEVAFVARYEPAQPGSLRILAMYYDGKLLQDISYPIAGTPCETVLGQQFRAYAADLQVLFPDDDDARAQCTVSYAGHPLVALDGSPLGIVSVASRRPLTQLDRVEAMLKIFAMRAAAEVERLRANEALQRSEASYRAIFEASEDAIFIHDWDTGAVLDVNTKACETYGYSREELRRGSVADISSGVFPYTAEEALRHMQLARLGRCPPFEWQRRNKDGSLHWDEVRLKPAVLDGRPHLLAFSREITAQKRALEDLRLREEQYRAIFESSQDGLFMWDEDLRIVDVNPAGLAIYGYRREDIVGRGFPRSMPEAYVRERRQLVRRALAGETIHLETIVLRPDGTSFDADLRIMPFVQRGQPHALTVVRDISERRRRERELQRDHVLTQADAEVKARHRAEHELALAGQELRFEVTATRKDGRALQAEVRGTPMLYRGRPHVLYATRDITERHAAEQRRVELERQLRQAQKMEAIGQLTGGLAHDFNNILTSVLGYVAMAQERPASAEDPVLARQLGQARLAAERARDHVAQLLAFSRPRRGERRLLAVAPVARQALQLLRPNLPSSIAVECVEVAGEAEPVPPVIADPVQLEQVLFNLCINARDAIRDHGTIRVRTGCSAAQGHCASCSARLEDTRWVWVEVADDGRGMPQEVIERMFEPFFTTKEVGKGTGMGLAMVHGIVHDHGGHIEVASEPGRGSVFRVLLPAAAQEAWRADAPAAPAPAAVRAVPPLQGRVLLVEDESIVSDYMVDLLTRWGLEVALEHDPLAAARRLAAGEGDFDLLLTDQTMPGMTGLALSKLATQHRPGLPVLLYTGNASEIGQEELSGSGVNALLRKPIDGATLRPLLCELLGRPGGPRDPAECRGGMRQ